MIDDASKSVDAIVDLLPVAIMVARPAGSIATNMLDEREAVEKGKLLSAKFEPSLEAVDTTKAAVAAERGKLKDIQDHIFALNDEIGTILDAQRIRRASLWGRLFPKRATDGVLVDLRTRRADLVQEQKVATRHLLRALGAEDRAEKALKEARLVSRTDHGKVAAVARMRLAAIARARSVLRHWPALSYVGVRTLLSVAVRIEKAKRRTWDETPTSNPSY